MKQVNKIQKKKEQKLSVKILPYEATYRNGMPLGIIKDVMGHSRLDITINFIKALSREQG